MTDAELYQHVVVQFREPDKSYLSAVCRILRSHDQKLKNQRLRMDEMWARQFELGRILADEQARSAHLLAELNKANDALHECQKNVEVLTTRLMEILHKAE